MPEGHARPVIMPKSAVRPAFKKFKKRSGVSKESNVGKPMMKGRKGK